VEEISQIKETANLYLHKLQHSPVTAWIESSSWSHIEVARFGDWYEKKYLHYCLLRAFNNALGRQVLTGKEMFVGQTYRNIIEKRTARLDPKGNWRIGDLIHALMLGNHPFRIVREKQMHNLSMTEFFKQAWNPGRYILCFKSGVMAHNFAMIYSPEISYFVDDVYGYLSYDISSLQLYNTRQLISLHEIQENQNIHS
jgi:hypothetical protein